MKSAIFAPSEKHLASDLQKSHLAAIVKTTWFFRSTCQRATCDLRRAHHNLNWTIVDGKMADFSDFEIDEKDFVKVEEKNATGNSKKTHLTSGHLVEKENGRFLFSGVRKLTCFSVKIQRGRCLDANRGD